MPDHCELPSCLDAPVTTLSGRQVCAAHFIQVCYDRLREISVKIEPAEFDHAHADGIRLFLEDCMRYAADLACASILPLNLERAQILDLLTWAAELHGRLRRGPRVPAKIPIVVKTTHGNGWEEQTETVMLSRHGLQVACRHRLNVNQLLTCVRLDNGWHTEARVVWTRTKSAEGENEAGLEFLEERNFWQTVPPTPPVLM